MLLLLRTRDLTYDRIYNTDLARLRAGCLLTPELCVVLDIELLDPLIIVWVSLKRLGLGLLKI
jgi:hypothetical protein